jgi:hypothetical protein
MDEHEMGFPENQPPETQQWYAAPYMQPPNMPGRGPRPRTMRRWLMIRTVLPSGPGPRGPRSTRAAAALDWLSRGAWWRRRAAR